MFFVNVILPAVLAAGGGAFIGWWICMVLMTLKGYFDKAAKGDSTAKQQHVDAVRITSYLATALGVLVGGGFGVYHYLQDTESLLDFSPSGTIFGVGYVVGTAVAFFGLRYPAMIE